MNAEIVTIGGMMPPKPDAGSCSVPRVQKPRGLRLRRIRGLFSLSLLLLAGGCATHYDVVLNNGTLLLSKGKPRLDKATQCWVFTDIQGRQMAVPSIRIREIAPASMSSQRIPASTFKLPPAK
jgi:hypothetical protein